MARGRRGKRLRAGSVRGLARKGVSCLASASLVVMLGAGVFAAPAQADDDVVSVGTAAQLRALADNPAAYAGKTVKLTSDIDLGGTEFTPIGTPSSPFTGTFDGGNHSISGLVISGSEYLGLFGYVGAGGVIKDVHITNGDDSPSASSVTATSDSQVIHCVGSVAGYVYGATGSGKTAVENCSSEATVTVTSTMKPSSKKSAEFTPEGTPTSGKSTESLSDGYSDNGITIEYVGGVVGYCAGSISGTNFTGTLSATTHEEPQSEDATTMGTAVGGVAGQVGGFDCIQEIDGADETLLKAQYPKGDGTYETDTDDPATVSNCSNSGTITVVSDAEGGLDRFGVTVSTTFNKVGGVIGGSFASVRSCDNEGDLDAVNSTAVGGVVGSLRGNTYTGTSLVAYDAGEQFTAKASGSSVEYTHVSTGPTLVAKGCTTQSSVTGSAQVGGIVGVAGTHTEISFCKTLKNGQSGQIINGTRWNKPTVGGIVGACHGNVSYCYNNVDCKTETGGGFFVAGIAGSLARYTVDSSGAKDSPIPDLGECYFTGVVQASGSYRQGGIVGENSGYVHDSYCIEGHVQAVAEADSTNPHRPMIGEDLGTVASTVKAVTADYMLTKEFCADLNAGTELSQYQGSAQEYFLPDASGDDASNSGYPVFAYERSESTKGLTVLDSDGLSQQNASTATAAYRADANPVPTLEVTYNGTTLVQGADYFVVPDSSVRSGETTRNVKDIKDDTFTAHIVGIGDYTTPDTQNGSTFTASYKVVKGDFSTCSISIASKYFNYLAQYPDKEKDIVVYDAAGAVVSSDQYTISDPGTCINYHVTYKGTGDGKYHVGYEIKATATDDANYTGSIYGYFQIKKANLLTDEKTHFEGFTVNGQTWKWSGGHVTNGKAIGGYLYQTDSTGVEVKGMSVVYTGAQIKPSVIKLSYEDGNGTLHELKAGKDYRVVYGDPGRDDLISSDNDSITNVASADGTVGTRPCVTIRFVPGDSHNFTNYQNFFFSIVKADVSKSSQVKVKIPSSIVPGDSSAVRLTGYTGVKLASSNYDVSFGKVSKSGKVKVTVKGKNNLKETYSKTVKAVTSITKGGAMYKVTSVSKHTLTLSKLSKKTKKLTIPASIKVGGSTYKVTSVAKRATSKCKKLASVTIGSNVKSIGAKAFFGCKKLSKVTIKSKLLTKKSVGKKAFASIASKPKVKVPKGMAKQYKKVLKAGGLTAKAQVKA